MIKAFLPEHDRVVPNPHYKCAAPMRLYSLPRVEAAEATDEWRALKLKAEIRQSAAFQAAETKKRELLRALEGVAIEVPKLTEKDLVERACAHYNQRAAARFFSSSSDEERFRPADAKSDESFLARISVNYLRHEMSPYEERLAEVFGMVGAEEARRLIREKVYAAIARAYPGLTEECGRQLERRRRIAAALETSRPGSSRGCIIKSDGRAPCPGPLRDARPKARREAR